MRLAVVRAISFFARKYQLRQYPFRTVALAFGYISPIVIVLVLVRFLSGTTETPSPLSPVTALHPSQPLRIFNRGR